MGQYDLCVKLYVLESGWQICKKKYVQFRFVQAEMTFLSWQQVKMRKFDAFDLTAIIW